MRFSIWIAHSHGCAPKPRGITAANRCGDSREDFLAFAQLSLQKPGNTRIDGFN
jgi:hypothetical protein